MIKVNLYKKSIADGQFDVKEKGFLMARLSWADADGELKQYSPFAYLPLNPDGKGEFSFTGGRTIPWEASRVCVKSVTADFSEVKEEYWEIPESHRTHPFRCSPASVIRIGLISDLHMTNKPGRINAVMQRMKDMDVILMAGDLVNNCDPMQYDRLAAIIEETVPDKPIFAVAGNHDIPDGQAQNYRHFEQWLHGRTRKTYTVTDSGSGAFAVMLNPGLDLIGLNPLYARKIFHFPDKGEQLKWLRQYLEDRPAGQHIIMCHAPLLAHNPQRVSGKDSPYLAQDMILQDIVDRKKKIIFISGHTHLSPNVPSGCVDYDSVKENLYINDGSVCPVDLKSPEVILPSEWSDGCYTEMMVYKDSMEIIMRYLRSGKRISRGYYNIPIVSS